VFAEAESFDGDGIVEVSGKADVYGIGGGIRDGAVKLAVGAGGGEIDGGTVIAGDGTEIAGKFAFVGAIDGDDFRAWNFAQGAEVGSSHVAETEDGESHRAIRS